MIICVVMQSEPSKPAYKRIVLKLSGEALRERGARENISPQIVREIAQRIKEVKDLGVQTSVVIGGGNILTRATHQVRSRPFTVIPETLNEDQEN